MAALEAHHALRAVGEPVDDLALALVAPLRADHDNVSSAHGFPERIRDRPRFWTLHGIRKSWSVPGFAGFEFLISQPRPDSSDQSRTRLLVSLAQTLSPPHRNVRPAPPRRRPRRN